MCRIICQKNGLFRLKIKWNGIFSLALVIVDKWYRNFRAFRSKREKGNTSKGITFFSKTIHRDEPFHLNSLRNFRKFHSNGKRSGSFFQRPREAEKRNPGNEVAHPYQFSIFEDFRSSHIFATTVGADFQKVCDHVCLFPMILHTETAFTNA